MSLDRLLGSTRPAPSGRSRGCPPHCEDSCFPSFTAWRLELGYSRRHLAQHLAAFEPEIDERLVARIEAVGQRPPERFLRALEQFTNRPTVAHLFEEVA